MPKVIDYQQGVINSKYKGLQGLVKARGITVVQGWGA